jgi:hypothetical protein
VRGLGAIGLGDASEGVDSDDDGRAPAFAQLDLCVRCEGFGVKQHVDGRNGPVPMHRFWWVVK